MTQAFVSLENTTTATSEAPATPLAEIRVNSGVSVIVPTFREVENIPHVLERLDKLR